MDCIDIEKYHLFNIFDAILRLVYFKYLIPNNAEFQTSPNILFTSEGWDSPDNAIYLHQRARDNIEMWFFRYLFLSFFRSGIQGSKAYSLWGGVFPSLSIGYDYL